MFKILLICGGPSLERGISLNTTRSVYDNIGEIPGIVVEVIFINTNMDKYKISQQFLYSNTPSDFDFKLKSEGQYLAEDEFRAELKSADLVFPAIHGKYGEDGALQRLLESLAVNFVGSGAESCARMYNKEEADRVLLRANDFYTVPKLVIRRHMTDAEIKERVTAFFTDELKDVTAEVVVKPVEGGSSIGVEKTAGIKGTLTTLAGLFSGHHYDALLVESLCRGKEFTIIILENKVSGPVALLPTEIECKGIFTQEKKYLPSDKTHFYCPARFPKAVIAKIRTAAERLFSLAGARDFLRIDGWVLDSGEIYFSDFNPISGMEQNSFFFQQGAKIGLTHYGVINCVLNNAAARHHLVLPQKREQSAVRKKVFVLMGGWTSERQVSLMSGTNVWLKLLHSPQYAPTPFLLFREEGIMKVWELPYAVALNHTVEEIIYQYHYWQTHRDKQSELVQLIQEIRQRLQLQEDSLCSMELKETLSLAEFIDQARQHEAYVFLGLHGGFGEDGSLQKMLEEEGVPFNGSGSVASNMAMDKFKTGQLVMELGLDGVRTARKKKLGIAAMGQLLESGQTAEYWAEIQAALQSEWVVIKPNADGCSTGVIVLQSLLDFETYLQLVHQQKKEIEPHTFVNQPVAVALSTEKADQYLLEEYIPTEKIRIRDGRLEYSQQMSWVEMTVGVLEKEGVYHALNPSITIAEDAVLSVQEKFQGGIGVNITPPPEEIVAPQIVGRVKRAVEKVAEKLAIKDYSRIDIFVHLVSGEIIIIEANTLPGLSPSTVLFQQGVKEADALLPLALLETIINF